IGPDGILTGLAQQSAESAEAVLVPALRRNRPEPEALAEALAQLHVDGVRVDWAAFYAGTGAHRVELPTYAFQRGRYWVDAARSTSGAGAPVTHDVPSAEESRRAAADLHAKLDGLPAAERARVLLGLVRTHVAAVLGYESAATVEADLAFRDMGFDSLAAVELRKRLTAAGGCDLPATLIFDYPTPRAAAAFLGERLDADSADSAGADPAAAALAELDRIEAVLTGFPADGGDTEVIGARADAITARLEAVVRRWRDARGPGGGAADDGPDLETVTDEELFDVLDSEFGIS
ncbi:phosphopantetheine-binding protein, partial [Streptomyces sp. NPDC054838]